MCNTTCSLDEPLDTVTLRDRVVSLAWSGRYMFYTQYLTWCFNQTRCDAMERERREVREARWMLERDWALQL